MNEPDRMEGRLWVALRGDSALVRVLGRANFATAARLQEFGQVAQGQGLQRLILDAGACEAMDSTFLGAIVGLASKWRDAGGRVCVVRLPSKLRRTFDTLGIGRVVDLCEPAELPADAFDGEGVDEAAPEASPPDLHRVVVEAHETLSGLSEENRLEFKDVLMFLRDEPRER